MGSGAATVNDQYMLGPDLLVAPVVAQNATARDVYFPCPPSGKGAWRSFWHAEVVVPCADRPVHVSAPLDVIPVYWRA